MDSFQIRTRAHPFGELWVNTNMAGNVVLEAEDGTRINLGTGEDAHLVAKCIEVSARWEISDEFRDATEEALERTLEQILANHENIKSRNE